MLSLFSKKGIFLLGKLSLTRAIFNPKLYLLKLPRYFKISAMIVAVLVTKMSYAKGGEFRWNT